jgi:hypothetical protein
MSRIAFFTESLPPDEDPISSFSFDLVKTLADQQHEVRVFSTYVEGGSLPAPHSRIEILRPFRNWGWLELPKMLPLLLDFQPDVIHLVQPRAAALRGWTNAMTALPSFSPLMGRPAIVASFYDLHEKRLKEHRLLLLASDVVTVSNQPQLELLESFYTSETRSEKKREMKRPLSAIVPISTSMIGTRATEGGDHFVRKFIGKWNATLFVPGQIDEQTSPRELFELLAEMLDQNENAAVVFGGGWGEIPQRKRHELMSIFGDAGSRVLISGLLDEDTLRFCLSHARLTVLSMLSMTSLRLTQVLSEALSCSAVLAMTREQSLLAAIPWKDRQTGFLVEEPLTARKNRWRDSLRDAIHDALNSEGLVDRIREHLPDFVRAEGLDHPANTMSRLYAEALTKKRSFSRR